LLADNWEMSAIVVRHIRLLHPDALAVLNEAMASGNGTPQLVRDVWTYLEKLPQRPTESFGAIQ